MLAALVTDAGALDPNRLPSQYVREQWTTGTRFPGGAVNGITQTADGYLWIGTDRGLLKFDGFNFRPVSFASVTNASNVSILQLLTDANGRLWIRPEGAYLVSQEDGHFESVRYGLFAITAVARDKHDGVLVSDIEQGTFRFRANGFEKLGPTSPPVISLAETAEGKIWVGTLGDGIFVLTDGRATRVNTGLPDRKINSLLPVGEELWVGTDTGLYHGNGSGFRRFELPSFLGNVQVLSLLRDRDSNIWVGTTRGLLRINAKGISFSEENELRGDGGINVLFEDREGNLWIGGARGLGRIRDSAFVTYSSISDRRFEHDGAVYADPEGRTWFAPAQGGLYVLQNGRVQPITSVPRNEVVYSISGRADVVWAGRQRGGLTRLQFRNGAIRSQSYTEANGLAQNSVYAVYESRDGSVWAGTLNGGISKFKDGHFTTYTTTNGLASNTVSSILETRDGAMWFATPGGLSSFSNGQWRTYTTVEGLPSPEVNCLFEDSSGTLWSGTSAGLAFFASNRFQVPHESPDVLREQILGMAEDKSGRFWISTSDHVLRVPRDKLVSGVLKAVDVREYDQGDGLESTEGVKRSRSVVLDPAGRIWFSLSSGLSVVNPSQITDNSVPALPHIETITADNNTVDLADSVRIPPSPRRITFEFTGLSLVVPGRVRFRYFLEGFDSSWSQPVAAREAVYTNLGPGSYRFRLVASNSEGLWNGPETAIVLNVAPAYYQTVWFRSLGVFLLVAVLAGLHRLRLRHLERQRDALRKTGKELRDVIDTIQATVWCALPDGSNSYVNKHFVEYSGLSAEQTAGSGWQAVIHPDDLERHAGKWMVAVATGKPHENEVRFRRSDGQYRWHLDRGVPLRDEDGNIVRWYGITTDIEDRKRAEEALQRSEAYLAEAQRLSQTGSFGWKPDSGEIVWSEETYRIFDYDHAVKPTISLAVQRVHPDDRPEFLKVIESASAGATQFEHTYRLLLPDGSVKDVHALAHALQDASGNREFVGAVTDITSIKRAEEELRTSEAYLAEAQRLSQTGSWAWSPDDDIGYWSEECYRVLSFDPQDGLPRFEDFFQRIHPDDQPGFRQLIQTAICEKAEWEADYRIVHPDALVRNIHVVGHPVLNTSGHLVEFVGTVIDITERKRAEEELRKSEFYLAEGQRLAQMGSWAFNPSGCFDYWSEELFRIYGLDPQKGAPTLEEYLATVHPQDRDFMANTIKRMHAERSGCDVKKRIVRSDGEQRYIRCVGIPVVEGEVLKGFLGTAIDITEQEVLNQELERRQAYLAEAQRLTHTGSWAINVATDEHFWSEEVFRIYDFDPVKVKPAWPLILDRVHPDDRASLEKRKKMEFTQTGWADSEGDYRIVVPGGKIKHLHTIAHPAMDASGKIIEIIGTTMDVTESKRVEDSLRRSERHLTEAQRLTNTGSWVWRVPDRNAVHLSEEWYRIYGFDPAEGAPAWAKRLERVHPEDRVKWKGAIEQAILEKADYDVEFRILFPNGKVKWIHTVGHPVLSGTGDLEQFVGSSTDITERKCAEQEREKLRQLEADLAHINRVSTLGEMAATLAHEIKQPIAAAITSANSCIEWLAHEPPNLDRARAAATKIDKYGNRAAEIIDRIRSFYRKSPPHRELVDVNKVIQEMLTLLKGEATRHSVAMHTELAAELPTIMADRVQLQQVFMNLILNAIEAMKDSGGELTVKSEPQDGQLQFSVSDTGVGLSMEKMDQIFSAFFTTKPQGTGMGLAISRSIVESHGGRLWANGNGEQGATFYFSLPM